MVQNNDDFLREYLYSKVHTGKVFINAILIVIIPIVLSMIFFEKATAIIISFSISLFYLFIALICYFLECKNKMISKLLNSKTGRYLFFR